MDKQNFERKQVLQKIQSGQLTAAEGLSLLQGLLSSPEPQKLAHASTSNVYFRPHWVKKEGSRSSAAETLGVVVIFDDREDLHTELLGRSGAADRIVRVRTGDRFQALDEHTYELNPSRPDEYRQLVQSLLATAGVPKRIVHLWSEGRYNSVADAQALLDKGVYSLFYLSQALLEQRIKDSMHLLYAFTTVGLQEQPFAAAVGSLARTIRLEHRTLTCQAVELSGANDLPRAEAVADWLLAEWATAGEEAEVRYVDGERFVRRLEEVQPDSSAALPLRSRGVYLITGGLGGLGTMFADHLASSVQARLVLTGRSELTAQQQEQLQAWKARGADVLYVRADLADQSAVEQLVRQTKERFGALHGILHSAGLLRDSFLLKKTESELQDVFAPKVIGTVHLDEATRGEALDFFAMFSSTAALQGSVGQSDYAYANAFLDRFANWRTQRGRAGKTLSINWPLWEAGGMKVPAETIEALQREIGLRPLSKEQGIAAFECALRSSEAQWVVMAGDADRIRRAFAQEKDAMRQAASVAEVAVTSERAVETAQPKSQSVSASQPNDQVQAQAEQYLKKMLAREFKLPVDQIVADESFEAYGIDSMIIMSLTRELESTFGDLSKTLFFEYQNTAELASYFVDHHFDAISRLIGPVQSAPVQALPVALEAPTRSAEIGAATRPRFVEPVKQAEGQVAPSALPAQEEIEIAIVGISGRYPMARNLEQFWNNLKEGKDCITEIPSDRWDHRPYFDPTQENRAKSYAKWGGFIDDVDKFDPLFFNISPREADYLDPQERLFLETVWNTLEDAGYTRDRLKRDRTGVFVGVMYGHYQFFGLEDALNGEGFIPSSSYASIANRTSYFFNFRGPSIAIDTMCSSSLTAIHLACDSIRKGESDLAIAGGVNVTIHPAKHLLLSQGKYASTDGRCRSFGEGGDGYVPGEGVGAVLLKPLHKALQDGDQIHGVVRSTSANHGGKVNGYTVPNPNAQGELIAEALRQAQIDPSTISYIEAHGTGTSLGDPIEMSGLMKAFKDAALPKRSIAIGSVKSNIGHLESAAGIAGVSKVLLQMKHQQLVPSLHSQTLNPNIKFDDSPFFVQQELSEWKRLERVEAGKQQVLPRRAGVSSFGAGGSNVHIILEEYLPQSVEEQGELDARPQLILLSAKNEDRLRAYAQSLAAFIAEAASGRSVSSAQAAERMPSRFVEEVLTIASEILKVNPAEISLEESIAEYGFDPMKLTELADRINDVYALDINASLFSTAGTFASALLQMEQQRNGAKPEPEHEHEPKTPLLHLSELAYTLRVGREMMEERLALVVSSLAELQEKLESFAQGKPLGDGDVQNNVKSGKGGLELLAGEEGRAFLQVIFHKRDLFKLAKLWAFGVEIEWQGLDSEHRYKRITLPTYPFLGERHWVPQSGRSFRKTSALHPLVDQINAKRSLQGGLVFQKVFHPTDRIVDEHRVMGQPMLPGVGYLEMAFAASRQIEDATNHRLTDVVWLQPIVVAEPKEVEIVLHQQGEDLSFEIVSHEAEAVVLHARGELKRTSDSAELTAQSLDIPALKSRMRKVDEYDSQHIYSLFDAGGVSYGPYFQGLGELWIGEEEVLATLHMASGTERELDSYTMHPSLMDSALHAMIGLQLGSRKRSSQPTLPFAVGEVEIVQPLKPVGFAYVLAAGENRFHVALLDEAGQVCIKLRDVALRERREEADDFYYGTTWVQEQLSPERIDRSAQAQRSVLIVHSAKSFGLEKELVKLCADADIYRMRLGQRNRRVSASTFEIKATEAQGFERFLAEIPAVDEVYFLGGLESDKVELGDLEALANSQELGVLSLFRLVKALSKQGLLRQNLKLKVVTNDVLPVLAGQATTPYAASLHGFTLTMAKEYAEASITCLDISLPAAPTEDELRGVTLAMVNEPGSPSGEVVAIRNGKRFVRTIHPISLPAVTDTPFKTKGVYLIVGGAGGIGLEMAKHLANTVQGRIVLIGRSELEEARIAKLGEIEALGGEVLYLQADATDPNSMRAAVASVKERFGSIDGVIHSAIVLRDRAIENMEEATLLEALTPKVQGSVVLQHVLQDEQLDFMLFLSSANSFVAGPGQSNYSAGCTFKDAFALHLDQVMPYPIKVINWGYWGSVGIVASEEYNKRMAEFGVHSIKPEEGMRAIETALANPISQLIPYKAERRVLEQMGVDYSKKIAVYPEREPSLLQIVATATPTGFADIDQLEGKQQDFAAFERFGQLLLLKAFREMGVFQSGGEQHEIEELKRQLGVLSEYDRLFDALLDMLRKGRFVELAGTRLITTTEVDRAETIEMLDDLVGEKERFLASRSDMEAYVNLVWACVTAYPEVLTGRKNHMEVMFPNGSKSLVENIYKGNRMTDYYNQLVASFVQEFVKQRLAQNDRASVRILEIGAGTGGTSSAVLERLRAFGSHVQYDYTDISVGFTQHGRRTFGTDYPFVEFTVLDIEKDPLGQGFEPNRIDLILATNVLHATKRIANTLGQAKKLLKKNGLIVINEATAVQDFATLTFGMTSGWWLYEDAEQRLEHSPLLSAKKWQEVLAEHGFGQAKVFGLSGQQADESGQTVIVGESDGLVWQDRKAIQTERAVQTSAAKQAVQTEQPVSTATRGTGKTKEEAVQEFVETIFSEVLRIDRSKLDRQTEFEQYGVDSLVVMELNKQFEKEFGKLPATLLFDHPTLARLSEFFLTEMPDIVAEKFGSADPADVVEQVVLEDLFGAKRERNSDAPREAEARILQLSGVPLREEFTNYWKTIREKGMAPQVIERVQPESLAARPREQLVHFLLDTPSAKNMEVVMTGQGPTILLIPGFGYTAPQWLPQIEEWARDHRIVVIHSPGFGLSEGGEDFSLVGVAQVLIEVLDRLAIGEPVHVVGSSWGGQVGQVLAEQHPQRIASLTLVSSFIQTQQDENIPLKEKVKQDFANIGAVDHYEEIANWEASNAHALHYAQVYAEQGPSTSEYLAAIRTPTLIVVGQADQVVDPAESKRLHEQIAGSTYCEIEGAGHAPSYTHAETFNRVVGEFIKRHTAEALVINASG